MPKFLTLMNPRRRHRRRRRRLHGAALMSHRRRLHRVRCNPSRRRRYYHRRRHRRSPPAMTPSMRRKISRAVRRSYRRRHHRRRHYLVRRNPTMVYSHSRRRHRGGGGGGGTLMRTFRNALSGPTLAKAGGAVAATFVTGMVINRWGTNLPGLNNKWGRVAYSVSIPIAGAFLVSKLKTRYSRDIAEGMVIGGLVIGINALIQQARATAAASVAPTGNYPLQDMGVAGELGGYGFYPAAPGRVGTELTGAFPTSAW